MQTEVVKIGVIGLGGRGRSLVRTLLQMEQIDVTAICDRESSLIEQTLPFFSHFEKKPPDTYTDHQAMLKRKDIKGVVIATQWIAHIPVAIDVMNAGLYAAIEVGGAASIDECRQLVRTSEQTGMPCMLLENCCYGKYEMMVLNMVKKGLFGEVVHATCGYGHDLRHMAARYNNRLYNNMHRNGDLYPTHGVGPIAKILDINRGNRFVAISSMASKAAGLADWVKRNKGTDHVLADFDYVKGDVVQSLIRCAHGQTVLVTHNVTLPRPYSRFNTVQGTRAIYSEDCKGIHIDGISEHEKWDPIDESFERYAHPLWKQFMERGVKGGHGGMDRLVLEAFAQAVAKGTNTPIDVYDTAVWMAITTLSEDSINTGGSSVPFPDFTNGRWIDREEAPKSEYSLDQVITKE